MRFDADKVVAAYRYVRPRAVGERRYEFADAHLLVELNEREGAAYVGLLAWETVEPFIRATRSAVKRQRRRYFRRIMQTADADERSAIRELQESVESWVGRTRPPKLLTLLCSTLSRQGLTATEIARLLEALDHESAADPEDFRLRVQMRVSRSKR